MSIFISALAFIVLLTLLILIHELGHFLVALHSKVEVEEFGFGLPPRAKTLFSWRGTDFTLNWIPFGGFVRLKGEGALDEKAHKAKGSFAAASIPRRIAILTAGVVMNFILALILLIIGFSFGKWVPTYMSLEDMTAAADRGEVQFELGVLIREVATDGNAAEAGVPADTMLLAIDNQPVVSPDDVVAFQEGKASVDYTLRHKGDIEDTIVTVPLSDGKAGVVLHQVAHNVSADTRDLFSATSLALRETAVVTVQTLRGLGGLISSVFQLSAVPDGITGIVGIAVLTHTSVQEGFFVYLRLVALLSLSLAILNVLPFPALDGGRLLFVLYEGIVGRRVDRRFELAVNSAGFAVLLLLILLVTFYDVIRLIP